MMETHEGFSDRNDTSLPTPVALFQFISLGLMLAIGSAGNCLVIYGFGRYLRLRRRSPHTFMLAFVAMDLARILFCFSIAFVTVVHPLEFKIGNGICRAMAFINVFIMIGNSLNVCGMALDRYFDNKYRAAYRRRCRSWFGIAIIFVVNFLAFIFAFPVIYDGKNRRPILQVQCMYPQFFFTHGIQTLSVLTSITTAFCLTNIIYAKLFLLLRGRRRMRPIIYEPAVSENWGFYDPRIGLTVRNRWVADSLSEAPIAVVSRSMFQSHPLPTNYEIALWRSKKQKDNEKLTKLCFIIHLLYSSMWLPYVITIYYLALANGGASVPAWLEIFVTWLTYLQPTITPFAFSALSGLSRRRHRVRMVRFSPTLSSSSA
ncbi:probable G protein-coupled receptor 85 [Argiope bruennichi]|uniref:Putative G protein-coupled receptor 85 like protein n=1 Tax=Argiope bruennichi TaxID=94029 RepID=A0A8T0FHU4_ARGBR|nr:probable G protein-coupled receptor 85 [Argiope bruennichi]KAF8790571.1 putative G protein-coupled receptor 85 like protein [Argiope bruennichi]